jgi:outer membrane protein assembly factor BamB
VPIREKRDDLSDEIIDIAERLLNLDESRTFKTIVEVRDALDLLFPDDGNSEEDSEDEEEGEKDDIVWRHYLGNRGRTNSIGSGPEQPLVMKWSTTVPESSQSYLAPYKNLLISLSDRGNLYSLDSTSGSTIKKENMKLNPVAPIIIGDQLCICSSSSQLSLNITDLSKKWEFRTKSMILAAPSFINNSLCYVSYDGFLIFVNPEDGKAITMENINAKIMCPPAFDDSKLYIPTLSGTMLAIDLESRTIIWQQNTKVPVMSAPSMLKDILYIANSKGQLMALKSDNGDIIWEKHLTGTVSHSVKLLKDRVFGHSTSGILNALNPEDGSIIWETTLSPGYECLFALTEKYLYLVDSRNCLLLLSTDSGTVDYSFQLPEQPNAIPLVVNDTVYVSLKNGRILALHTAH